LNLKARYSLPFSAQLVALRLLLLSLLLLPLLSLLQRWLCLACLAAEAWRSSAQRCPVFAATAAAGLAAIVARTLARV
jgi:hypothetical protein